jgi:replicative DNA helicase
MGGDPLAQNAVPYARIVEDQSLRRRLAAAGRQIQQLASQQVGRIDELLDETERKVFYIAEKRREGDLKPVRDLMEVTLELLDTTRRSFRSTPRGCTAPPFTSTTPARSR